METMNMPLLDSAGPTRLFDAVIESRPHDMFPDLNVGAFQPEAQKDSLVFAPAVNWQAIGDAGLAGLPQTEAAAPTFTAPSTSDQSYGSLIQTVDSTDLWPDTNAAPGDFRNEPASTSDYTRERAPTESLSSKALRPRPSKDQRDSHTSPQRRQPKAQQSESPKDSHHDEEDAAEAGSASPPATDRKMQRLREKNKLAAAKCRSRQRKQVQTIESKCNHLSAANGELKRQVHDLAGELNGLRAFALQHQGCNCPVAGYNLNQAKRVAADLQVFGTTGVEVQQKQQLRRQSGLGV
ncbi:hypothetical protein WHR41_09440 [Cladosporium halotolerans]|uniref:BZIP domain-containing protein n=1 Tax=Cladosporium halotolerans TaxID=1052096 RepID=A0AB34KD88_9PEZI